jgi:FlaG/FlaF family flagellin (archaellin)
MKKIVIFLVCFAFIIGAALVSCKTVHPVVTTNTVTHDSIVEHVTYVPVNVSADSATLQALILCDSTGQAYLSELNQIKGQNVNINTSLKQGRLSVSAKVDSFKIFNEIKERLQYHSVIKVTEVEKVPVVVNKLKNWQKCLMVTGLAAIFLTVLALLYNLRKWLL